MNDYLAIGLAIFLIAIGIGGCKCLTALSTTLEKAPQSESTTAKP